jgi:hypothetical protein
MRRLFMNSLVVQPKTVTDWIGIRTVSHVKSMKHGPQTVLVAHLS